MKAKITTAANIPAATRRAVYRRDGYRCAARSRKRTRRTLWNTSQTSTRKKV